MGIFDEFIITTKCVPIASRVLHIYKLVVTSNQGVPGVLRFLTHNDIPTGAYNSFVPKNLFSQEEVLCSGRVLYAGQPVGIIVAGTVQPPINHRLAITHIVQKTYKIHSALKVLHHNQVMYSE